MKNIHMPIKKVERKKKTYSDRSLEEKLKLSSKSPKLHVFSLLRDFSFSNVFWLNDPFKCA